MMNKTRGFTLIELLVAITILAIVAVLGWRGLDGIVRARVALNADLDQTRGLQLAFAQMQSDCGNIATTAVVGNRPLVAAQDGSLTLVRMVFAENQPSRLQVVAYRLRDGILTRRESVPTRELKELDDAWAVAAGDRDTAQPVVLQADVDQMAIRSWASDGKGWRNGVDNTAQNADSTTVTSSTSTSSTSTSSGAAAAAAANLQAAASQITGLEVALQLRGRSAGMVKVFLLGAV
jgi:general secretion pathway protein J